MELLHSLWNVVSTEDENLTKYVVIVLAIIENYVTMLFFTSLLNINYTRRQKNIYILIMELLVILSKIFIPNEISIFFHLIITFIVIKLIFKSTIIKSILAELITMLITVIIESIYAQLYFIILGKTFVE